MVSDRRSTVLGIAQLVFVVLIVFFALSITRAMKPKQDFEGGQNVAFADSTLNVTVTRPKGVTFTPRLSVTGTVVAQTETQIAPQVSGRVVWVSKNFTPGANVKKGELLFRVESEDFELAVEQASANISASLSDLKLLEAEAKLALKEWQDLYLDREISDLAARKPQMESARARLSAAEASKKTAQLALRRTRVSAPANARILNTSLDVGQLVSPAVSIGRLYALDNVEIAVPMSPEDLELITPAADRKATLVLGNENVEGVISRLGSVLDPRTRQVTAYIKPDNVAGLTIGSFVTARIDVPSVEGALQIPVTALSGRDRVWVIEGGELQSRKVNILDQSSHTVMVMPFDTGEGVLTIPPAKAYEGQKVKVKADNG